VIFTEEGSQRALALDSVNLLRDPFVGNTTLNFSGDHRTRLILLAGNIDLLAGETSSVVTVEADDGLGGTYPVTVESVSKVPGQNWLTQVMLRFPDQWMTGGDVWITLKLRGVPGNKAFVTIKP
jgi:hypothetical protein